MRSYPNLLYNGKIFPSWIVYKFKDFLLEGSEIDTTNDICNITSHNKLELRKYQLFISKYMDYNSPYSGILLYHGTGVGKTATAIQVYNNLYNYSSQWNVIILLKAALKPGWNEEMGLWLNSTDKENRLQNIFMVSYDAPNSAELFEETLKRIDVTKKNLYIIDEVHNFIRNVYNNVLAQKPGRGQKIYDYLLKERRENTSTKMILITATPLINHPFELALLFNLLRPGSFPSKENEFNDYFITQNKKGAELEKSHIRPDRINMFQRRILGLVSYMEASNSSIFAKKNVRIYKINMPYYQTEIYKIYNDREKKIQATTRFSKKQSKIYKVYTRQACNFVFPDVNGIDSTKRPRPSSFKLSEKEAQDILKGKIDKIKTKKQQATFMDVEGYKKSLENYMTSFETYLHQVNNEDIKQKHTIKDDFNNILKEFNKDPSQNVSILINKLITSRKSSVLLKVLYECSPKYCSIMFYIMQSKGPVIVYSAYVLMEGIQIFKVYLSFFGFVNYNKNKINASNDYMRYAEYNGTVNKEDRNYNRTIYNTKDNCYGKDIKIMLVSPAGSEGITLMSVRQVHIIEPHWNEALIEQIIGRGVRYCSHKYLPLEERNVDIYRYMMTYNEKDKTSENINDNLTTDEYIYEYAINKQKIMDEFLNAMKEVAVDCELNKMNNSINNKNIKCFKFEESALLNNRILPAYNEDLKDDVLINSGTNAINTHLETTKVYKISAVIVKYIDDKDEKNYLNTEDSSNTNIETGVDTKIKKTVYSNSSDYWLNRDTDIVYDYKYKYMVGKLKKDNDGNYERTEKEDFIIDYIVPYTEVIKK